MILHGQRLIIGIDGTPIAGAKSCEISVEVDTMEVASPTSGDWHTHLSGRKGWSITTGYLVTAPQSDIPKVGAAVQIIVTALNIPNSYYFEGFVQNVTVLQQSYAGVPEAIVFDTTSNNFVARVTSGTPPLLTTKYYLGWSNKPTAFTTPSQIYKYINAGNVYDWNGTLVQTLAYTLKGNATVKRCRISGTVGSLAQGSFEFLGNGPITTPTTT